MKVEAPSLLSSAEELWTSLFDNLCERIGPIFARSETREGVKAYLKGLLSPVERKNGWQLSEEAGLSTPYAMQYLLNRAVWESDEVRDVLQAYIREMIADPNGVHILDETGFLKKGIKSVGVQRQYSGTAGRVENSQIGVFLAYATKAGHTLVDRRLYMPKSWMQDPERCREAHVPEEVRFATKPQLAAEMVWHALDAGLPAKWVTGDCVYGSNHPLRTGLEKRKQAYAFCVKCSEKVKVQGEAKRVDRIASLVLGQSSGSGCLRATEARDHASLIGPVSSWTR
jgi:SRSO17 transposase